MKIAKFFAGIFGAIGTVLLVGSIGLCLFSLNAEPKVGELPAGAESCADAFSAAIAEKDYAGLEACIYGQPELGLEGTAADPMAQVVWDLQMQTLAFSWQGDCYMEGASLRRDGTVTYLDVASVTGELPARAHALLTQKVEAATEMAQLYDDSGEFREELVTQTLYEALDQCCREDSQTITAEVTVELVNRDGQWWAVPDGTLWTALSGGLA